MAEDLRFTVDGDPTPEMLDRIERIKTEHERASKLGVTAPEEEESKTDEGSDDEMAASVDPAGDPVGDDPAGAGSTDVTDQKIKVTIKGKEKELTLEQVKSALGRQEKYDQLLKSEELELGKLAAAARKGDEEAKAKLQEMLGGPASEDEDPSEEDDSQEEEDDDQAYFAEVKKDVDFKENLSKMNTALRSRMPVKVWESYNASPAHRKAMYDLVKSGRSDDLLDQLDSILADMPITRQIEIESDPDSWGDMFLAVVRRDNAKKKTKEGGRSADASGIDSVSSGKKGKVKSDAPPKAPDFMSMSSKEFNEYKIKMGLAST